MQGATEYHLDIAAKNDATEFIIKACPASLDDEEMEQSKKKLNAPRNKEIEQDYWALMGESEDYCELTLVGMMCDGADVACENGVLTIKIRRNEA
jgi:hypothetical protein